MNKWALITGGAKRVGRHLSMHFAQRGYNVLLHVNQSIVDGQTLIGELSAAFPTQHFVLLPYNLCEWKTIGALVSKHFTRYGLPEIIIHNASRYQPGRLDETTSDIMEEMMAIHLYAPMMINQQYKTMGGKGNIISVLDTAILSNTSSHAMYLLAKKALAEYTKMAALEWAPAIRVNGLALGPVLPPEGKDDRYFKQVVQSTPLQRQVELTSITASIDYLLANKNVSGQIIYCDSAQHLL